MKRYLALSLFIAATGCTDATSSSEQDTRNFGNGKADSDSSWCHGNLMANDGVEISIDYQVANRSDPSASRIEASPAWINVRRGDFGPGDSATAVIVERSWDNECGAFCRDNFSNEGPSHKVELNFENGRLTGKMPDIQIQHHDTNSNGGGFSTLFEVAIVVNDTWYKGTDGRNLRFIPTSFPGFCARGTTF